MAIQYMGQETLYDKHGNEIVMDMINKNHDYLDKKGWRRVVLSDMLTILDQIGNKKIKVLEFLIDNMNTNNEINLTQREINEATGISLHTINETMKALTEANIIKKHKRMYVLNTFIIGAKGSKEKNSMLCINYGFHGGANAPQPQEPSDEEKIAKLTKQLSLIESQINSIKNKPNNQINDNNHNNNDLMLANNEYKVLNDQIHISVSFEDKEAFREQFKTAKWNHIYKTWCINNNTKNINKLEKWLEEK